MGIKKKELIELLKKQLLLKDKKSIRRKLRTY